MTPCSACTQYATQRVHGFNLCWTHASGMISAVLIGDHTPVGYIMAASTSWTVPKVSAPETSAVPTRSPIMRHGAIPALVQPMGASPKSGRPAPVTATGWANAQTVRACDSTKQWRTR